MALKDLIAHRAKITEKQIEEIVTDYVSYDTDESVVVHGPTIIKLSNKGKVLVHLVALQGWPFVTEEAVQIDASPAELEKTLHIPGGSLRPILKDLKDRHLIGASGRRYSVSAPALHAIKAEITRGGKGDAATNTARSRARRRTASSEPQASGRAMPKKRRGKKIGAVERTKRLDAWISEGFFNDPRTLNDVHQRFHEEADIVSKTSLPGYLLDAVENDRLSRKKAEVGGRQVWVYTTKNKTPT